MAITGFQSPIDRMRNALNPAAQPIDQPIAQPDQPIAQPSPEMLSYNPNATYTPSRNEFGYNPQNPIWDKMREWDEAYNTWQTTSPTMTQPVQQSGGKFGNIVADQIVHGQSDQQTAEVPMSWKDYSKSIGLEYSATNPYQQEYDDYELQLRQNWENQQAADKQLTENRYDINLPGGSQNWDYDQETGRWTTNVNLGEDEQAIYDADIQHKQDVSDIRSTATGAAADTLSTPYSTPEDVVTPTFSGPAGDVPEYEGIRSEVRDALLSRVEGDIARDRQEMHAKLIANGIPENSEAYDNEMRRLERQLTDARQQAEIAATNIASQEYSNMLSGRQASSSEGLNEFNTSLAANKDRVSNALLERSVPLNEMQVLTGGQQISIPEFMGGGSAQYVPGADYTGTSQFQQSKDLQVQNMLNNLKIAQNNRDSQQVNNILDGLVKLGVSMIP